jgi:iron complex outermembrane receptor protein
MNSLLLCSNTFTPYHFKKISKKVFFSIALLFLTQTLFAQQTGTIKGTVKTSDGKPAEFVTIGLNGTSKSAIVNQKGSYQLHRIVSGTYTLTAKFIGLLSQSKVVEVKTGETTVVDFILTENNAQLQEVIVNGNKASKFTREASATVAKMPLLNMENPQVYTSVTKELIQDQQITMYSDIIKNVPGVILQLPNNANGPGGTVAARGFSSGAYLRNGIPGMAVGLLDPSNIETLEAIKGPSGSLFGGSLASFGGLFNRVTKKPFDDFKGIISYSSGNYGLSRLTADINTPLNEDKSLLFRVNAAKHYEGSFQDAGFSNYSYVAPSLTYKVNDKMTVFLDGEYMDGKYNSFYRLFVDASNATGVHSTNDLNFDFNRRFVGDDIVTATNTGSFYGQVDYKLADNWKSQTNFSYSATNSAGPSAYMSMTAGNKTLVRMLSLTDYARNAMSDVQQNFTGDFKIGGLRNRLLVGLDYYHVEARASSATGAFDSPALDAVNPGANYSKLTGPAVTAFFAGTAFTKTSSEQNIYSTYVQDVLNLTDRLNALVSLRLDRFTNMGTFNLTTRVTAAKYAQTAYSPKFGLVYQIIKDKVSLFGNYMNGFQNVAPVTQPDATISTFEPTKANQLEGGVKVSVLDGKLSGTLSYYDIEVSNIVRQDPDHTGFSIQNGSQISKGLEADIAYNPISGFNLIAGYAYNDSKYTLSAPNVDGLRPPSAGPKHMINAWASYRLTKGDLQGLGLGFGGNYASENITALSTTSSFVLPAYTILNASAFYDQPKYRLGLKVNNLTSEKYFIGWGTTIPQIPRSFIVEFALKFGAVK